MSNSETMEFQRNGYCFANYTLVITISITLQILVFFQYTNLYQN